MSEPDIAALARRLAEQNNVDWRALTGSGPDGKIVERDVLDYLARVMAGEEAVNPTPEPLPEGMQAWPDQDAPSYFKPRSASQQAAASGAAPAPEAPTAGAPADEPTDFLADSPAGAPADAPSAGAVDDVFAEPGALGLEQAADEELSDDIFLFDDDATGDDLDVEPAAGSAEAPAWLSAQEPQDAGTDAFADDGDDGDDLLVADDDEFGAEADDGYMAADAADAADATDATDAADGADAADAAATEPFGTDQGPPDPFATGSGTTEQFAPDQSIFGEGPSEPTLDVELDDTLVTGERAPSSAFGNDFRNDLSGDLGGDLEVGDISVGSEEPADVSAGSFESYDQDFTTPSEQFDGGNDGPDWSTGEDQEPAAGEGAAGDVSDDGGALPDLWATDGFGSEEEVADEPAFGPTGGAVEAPDILAEAQDGADELTVDFSQRYEAPAAEDANEARSDLPELTSERPVTETDPSFGEVAPIADDVEDLEQASALDEHDAVTDLQELDGEPASPAAAQYADLPLMRSGTVLRRHVDLSALAEAQLAAGLELGHEEPLAFSPFLVRAVAKAAAELGTLQGQVALAELGEELWFRRIDDAAERSFASLVQELAVAGSEEDELGLAAVDLSGFDMDEVLLDLDVPAITLGRTLYDTQRGSHRSTLSLSGDLPLNEGARLLARVADLLEAPVRLLL